MRLMETPDDVSGPVNLGNQVEFTIRQLAETVIALTGSSSKIGYRPLSEDDPRQRCPNISLMQKLLAWAPPSAAARRTDEDHRVLRTASEVGSKRRALADSLGHNRTLEGVHGCGGSCKTLAV
jgi:hypothetical protein